MTRWLAAAAVAALYLYGLDGYGLINADEPRYAAIGQEMARSGDWITPRLWGQPWFEKPVLLFWMVSAAHSAGLGGELAARLPVALLSIAFLAFFGCWMRRLFDAAAAWHSTAVLATSVGWFAYSRTAVTDLPLAATFSAAMLVGISWLTRGERRWLPAAGALLGVAMLAKGLVAAVLVLPLVWLGRARWRELAAPAAIALAVALPWYVAEVMRHGWHFVDVLFVQHHFGRFASGELQHGQPFWFYAPVFLAGLFPWTPFAALLFRRVNLEDPALRALSMWLGFGLLFFSAMKNKLPGYLLPMMPAAAALIGYHSSRTGRPRWLAPLSAALLGCVVPLAIAILPKALDEGLSRASLQWPPAFYLAAAIPVLLYEFGRQPGRAFAAVVVLFAAGLWLSVPRLAPRLDEVTARPFWNQEVAARRGAVCVEPWLRRSWRYGLNYYAGEELPDCEKSPEPARVTPVEGTQRPRLIMAE